MADGDLSNLGGLTGWVASVIESLGEVGVGLLVALENIVPPIPSEIVLALAGYLASEGRVNLVLVFLTATAGSVVGVSCSTQPRSSSSRASLVPMRVWGMGASSSGGWGRFSRRG